jgi:hypothetical protein
MSEAWRVGSTLLTINLDPLSRNASFILTLFDTEVVRHARRQYLYCRAIRGYRPVRA